MREINNLEYTLLTNFKLYPELAIKLLSNYIVKAKFKYRGFNGHKLYLCNLEHPLVYAKNKRDKYVTYSNNVIEVINSDLVPCGSNRYPSIAYKEGQTIELIFKSVGFPYVSNVNGWEMSIISIDKNNDTITLNNIAKRWYSHLTWNEKIELIKKIDPDSNIQPDSLNENDIINLFLKIMNKNETYI